MSLLIIALPLILVAAVGTPHLLREFLMIYRYASVPARLVQNEILPVRFGYLLKLDYEIDDSDARSISRQLGPDIGTFYPILRLAVGASEHLANSPHLMAYVDRKGSRAYLSTRKYDFIDAIFAPLFLLGMIFCAGIGSFLLYGSVAWSLT